MLVLQRLKDVKLGEPGKESSRQKAVTKLFFFIATGRNAMVVVICAIISYAFKSQGQTPFILTGLTNCLVSNISASVSSAEVKGTVGLPGLLWCVLG